MLLLREEMLQACRLDGREAVVCAFSGGPDSTALLLELKRLRDAGGIGPLYAGHFEHGIRGREARDDLAFCRKLCLELGVPLFSESGDVPACAEAEGLSLETAARKLRYAFLRRLKGALGAASIALGHHRDDQAETVLLHLVRGSGMTGLTGMSPRSGDLVRPLLGTGREDILAYLADRQQPYRLDSTNLSPDHSRNRLRQEGMAALKAINAQASAHIAQCADRLRAEDAFLEELTRNALKEAQGSRSALAKLPAVLQSRAALLLLRQVTEDFTEADVARLTRLFSLPSGRTVPLRGHLMARADGDRLYLGPEDADRLVVGSVWAEESCSRSLLVGEPLDTPWGVYRAEWVQSAHLPCPAHEAYADGDGLCGELYLRQARAGDRFVPLGMKGSKLLSDFYTDKKMDRLARTAPVVFDAKGPVFIPGGTVADRVRIKDETRRILHIIFEKGEASYGELGH